MAGMNTKGIPDGQGRWNWDPSGTLADMAVKLPGFFNTLGYRVPASFPEEFCRAVDSMSPEDRSSFRSFQEMEGLVAAFVVKTESEASSFSGDFKAFVEQTKVVLEGPAAAQARQRLEQAQSGYAGRAARLEESIRKQKASVERLKKKIDEGDDAVVSENRINALRKKLKKVEKEYEKTFGRSEHYREMLHLCDMADGKEPIAPDGVLNKVKEELKAGLKKAVMSKQFKELMAVAAEQAKLAASLQKNRGKTAAEQLVRAEQTLDRFEQEHMQIQESLQKILDQIRSRPVMLHKQASVAHRNVFDHTTAKNGVSADDSGGKALYKPFAGLTPQEKDIIRDYITDNARKFRTKITRNIRTGQHRKIDMATTCKKACGTDGIPLRLEYVKPHRQKAKLTLLLDISGSCRQASEMMISFMHEMRGVFPGGCDTYVFVDSLYDVSEMFAESEDAADSVKAVLKAVPTKGVYSDYYRPLKSFRENYMHRLTKDSIVIFIGDARNNGNSPGAEYIKEISGRARSVYWMNTEQRAEWDTGDSVMGLYAPYMDAVAPVLTATNLLDFLTEAVH